MNVEASLQVEASGNVGWKLLLLEERLWMMMSACKRSKMKKIGLVVSVELHFRCSVNYCVYRKNLVCFQ